MLGIKSYKSNFSTEASELKSECEKLLKRLKGKKVSDLWVVWENNNKEWFKNCPVIIQIENEQLELCANKFDEYSITLNTIDMSEKIDWFGMDEFDLVWKNDIFNDSLGLKKKKLTEIELIEYAFETTITYSKENPEKTGEKSTGWLINGIGLHFEESYISVSNGLDENMIEFEKDNGDKMRYTKIG